MHIYILSSCVHFHNLGSFDILYIQLPLALWEWLIQFSHVFYFNFIALFLLKYKVTVISFIDVINILCMLL